MVRTLWVSASQNFLQIENQLNIKKVMSNYVYLCSFPIFDIFDIHNITVFRCIWFIFDIFDNNAINSRKSVMACFNIFNIFDIHSITALMCIWSIFDTFDIALISCINLSQHLQHQTICIDKCPLMYTQKIRWQRVWMSGFLTILFEGLILIQRVKSNRVLIWSFKSK